MSGALLALDLEGGGRAEVVETDGDRVTLRSARAYPPGSPLSGLTEDGTHYRVKVRGSRRVGDDDDLPFRVEGRFVNLTRDQRLALTGGASST